MSFLTEIISAANEVEVSTVLKKTPDLVLSIEETKKELLNFLDDTYLKFAHPARQGKNLCEKVNSARINLGQLEECVNEVTKQDIGNVEKEIVSCGKQLSETKTELKILEHLISIHHNFIDATRSLSEDKYGETVELIKCIQTDMDMLQFDDKLIVLDDIQKQVHDLEEKLIRQMNNKVYQYVNFNSNENRFSCTIKQNNMLQELFSAYAQWDTCITILDDIAKTIWDYIFSPILNFETTVNAVLLEDKGILEIEILNKNIKNNYNEVFKNIITTANYFEKHLNYSLQDCTTIEYIGKDLKDDLCKLLIKNCLNETIPSNSEQLQNYDLIIKEVDLLQSKLISSGFFSEDMTSLLDHANNVDKHYIDKKCEEYLKIVKNIIKKDLHNMIEVGEPVDLNNPFNIDRDVFYQRSVSKSCLELVELTEDVLKQIIKTSEPSSKILYQSTKMIFAEYGDKIIEHHQKLLTTIPQQVALFFNNCTFLSHKLTLWDVEYGEKIKCLLNIEESLFSCEIQRLNLIGRKTFEEFVEQQIKQMEQIMKESGLTNVRTLEKLEPVTEKCIRQCLRQQELLKTVWHKVLSYSDYNKNLGITLNSLCKIIIDSVVKYQDITTSAGDQLVDVLKVIFTRGPKLFTDQKDVFIYVEQWHKLNELSFLLTASLLDIADRWADGKGPLALYFKSDELKQLIRALFQNTDRRAAVLAQIKEDH